MSSKLRLAGLTQALLQHPYNPCVQLHASTSVCTLIIPNTGCHTIAWTHKNTTHTNRSGYNALLVAAVPYPGKVTQISHKGQ